MAMPAPFALKGWGVKATSTKLNCLKMEKWNQSFSKRNTCFVYVAYICILYSADIGLNSF